MLHIDTGLDFFVALNPQDDIYDSLPPVMKDAIDAMSIRIAEDLQSMAIEVKEDLDAKEEPGEDCAVLQYARTILHTAPLVNIMDLPSMSQEERQRREERQRSAHHILSESFPLVQAAIVELGRDEVRRISYDKTYDRPYQFRSNYFDALKEKLAEAYMLDTTKMHLRQYLDHKFAADLGL